MFHTIPEIDDNRNDVFFLGILIIDDRSIQKERMYMENFAIMAPFNLTFFIVTAVFITILIVSTLLMRKKSDRAKRIVIASSV